MDNHHYPSKTLEEAVKVFESLPGIGRKTALRLVLHLLRQDSTKVNKFGEILSSLHDNIKFCKNCHNLSDSDICNICIDPTRDHSTVSVVENIRDVISIENTGQYHGIYHVLGGIISPMDGIGPSDLNIENLEKKAASGSVKEIILALSTTMEGDTTNFYLFRKISKYGIIISTLSRGVSIGDELEYTDEVTLGKSIINRIPFNM